MDPGLSETSHNLRHAAIRMHGGDIRLSSHCPKVPAWLGRGETYPKKGVEEYQHGPRSQEDLVIACYVTCLEISPYLVCGNPVSTPLVLFCTAGLLYNSRSHSFNSILCNSRVQFTGFCGPRLSRSTHVFSFVTSPQHQRDDAGRGQGIPPQRRTSSRGDPCRRVLPGGRGGGA